LILKMPKATSIMTKNLSFKIRGLFTSQAYGSGKTAGKDDHRKSGKFDCALHS